jgi:hypothetical protein
MHEQLLQCIAAARLVGDPFVVALLQPRDRAQLRLVRLVAALLKFVLVILGDVHAVRGALRTLVPALQVKTARRSGNPQIRRAG